MQELTVGAGGEYANWAAAWNYLLGIVLIIDDYDLKQVGDTIDDNFPNFPANGLAMNEHTVRFYCPFEDSHQGDPTKGFISYLSGVNGSLRPWSTAPYSVNDTIITENLYIRQLTGDAVELLYPKATVSDQEITVEVTNCMIRGFNAATADGIEMYSDQMYYTIKNCKIWNCNNNYVLSNGTIPAGSFPGRRFMENCTSGNSGTRGFFLPTLLGCEWNINNCVSIQSAGADWVNPGNPKHTVSNCASEDATVLGANAIPSIVPANEFQYHLLADDNQPGFLKLVDGLVTRDGYEGSAPQLGKSGKATTYATTDIAGNARP